MEELLRAHEQAKDFLETPPAGIIFKRTNLANVPVAEKAGDKIGRYKLLEQIGEGGCGVVYVAEQQEPVRRRVALKIIKLGMDTKAVIARFEAERQALALMDHPNIAREFDAGATETTRAELDQCRIHSAIRARPHGHVHQRSERDESVHQSRHRPAAILPAQSELAWPRNFA